MASGPLIAGTGSDRRVINTLLSVLQIRMNGSQKAVSVKIFEAYHSFALQKGCVKSKDQFHLAGRLLRSKFPGNGDLPSFPVQKRFARRLPHKGPPDGIVNRSFFGGRNQVGKVNHVFHNGVFHGCSDAAFGGCIFCTCADFRIMNALFFIIQIVMRSNDHVVMDQLLAYNDRDAACKGRLCTESQFNGLLLCRSCKFLFGRDLFSVFSCQFFFLFPVIKDASYPVAAAGDKACHGCSVPDIGRRKDSQMVSALYVAGRCGDGWINDRLAFILQIGMGAYADVLMTKLFETYYGLSRKGPGIEGEIQEDRTL